MSTRKMLSHDAITHVTNCTHD